MSSSIGRVSAPRSVKLPADHYAAKWPVDVQYTPAELTRLGMDHAQAPSDKKMLGIIQAFHGYLLKYMGMILHGHVSFRAGEVNKDTMLFLQNFGGQGEVVNRAALGVACRSLHLAFKGMNQGEIYDQIMLLLVKAVRHYDPFYNDKVRQVTDVLDRKFHERKAVVVLIKDVSAAVGYDCTRYLRLLGKRDFITPEAAEGAVKKGYRKGAAWPPPADFINAKPVGIAYFVPKWFRYFLTDWIQWRMGELESKEGVLQLDHRANASPKLPRSGENVWDPPIPHAEGDFTVARTGKSVAADVSMFQLPVDVGELSLHWVNHKSDGHFGHLTKRDRRLLYCVCAREMDWSSIAQSFNMTVREVKRWYNSLLADLRERMSIRPAA